MKTIKIIVTDNMYDNTAVFSKEFDSDVAWTEILDVFQAEHVLIGLLNATGYRIPNETD